ncbi:MAG: hypothetical protein A2X36_10025 [Elusimicrobia bacterium GWA2_69_24]|nr:MAG: hypothetical protein A2X36_10025 [Elusimicrobia bacterium GWA2_69_24]HBL17561.1 hypothetical protein [Elusimicrobiota bacterium]
MGFLGLLLKPFVWHPASAFIVAALFAIPCATKAYSPRSRKTLIAVAAIWGAYALWETYMTRWRSHTGDMAIRIDMALFGPVILLAAITGILTALFGHARGAPASGKE